MVKLKKNYQIDFLKLFFALSVFVGHARILNPPEWSFTRTTMKFGWYSVHFFFMISGLFMAAHYFKEKQKGIADSKNCGSESLCYVGKRFKGIAPLYFAAFSIDFVVLAVMELSKSKASGISEVFTLITETFVKALPELFAIEMCGIRPVGVNNVTWYISAMFIAMLPMYYIMKKFPDFFFHILSPLLALSLFAFFYNSEDPHFSQTEFVFVFSGGFLRAVCGMSFGVVSYLISDYITKNVDTERKRALLTAAEVFLTALLLIFWFKRTINAALLFPWSLTFPILLAIVHSGKSGISKLFESKIFKHCGSWSMWIYMNHYAAWIILKDTSLASIPDWKIKYALMIGMTLASCLISSILIRIFKALTSEPKPKHAEN